MGHNGCHNYTVVTSMLAQIDLTPKRPLGKAYLAPEER